jgi:translation elongation factor P/translation initiation factor 5A
MTNKYNLAWQIVRTQVRKIKEPDKKLWEVLNYLTVNPNKHNYNRVLNWIKMTAKGYKASDTTAVLVYEEAARVLSNQQNKYSSEEDNIIQFKDVADQDLLDVHKDLSKRKFDFQFKQVPKDHTDFMKKLEQELKRRGLK